MANNNKAEPEIPVRTYKKNVINAGNTVIVLAAITVLVWHLGTFSFLETREIKEVDRFIVLAPFGQAKLNSETGEFTASFINKAKDEATLIYAKAEHLNEKTVCDIGTELPLMLSPSETFNITGMCPVAKAAKGTVFTVKVELDGMTTKASKEIESKPPEKRARYMETASSSKDAGTQVDFTSEGTLTGVYS